MKENQFFYLNKTSDQKERKLQRETERSQYFVSTNKTRAQTKNKNFWRHIVPTRHFVVIRDMSYKATGVSKTAAILAFL